MSFPAPAIVLQPAAKNATSVRARSVRNMMDSYQLVKQPVKRKQHAWLFQIA
jgi:hypothetical protein